MKQRLVITLLLVLCAGCCLHAQNYLVFSVKGKVEKITNKGKLPLKQDEIVGKQSVINIPYGGCVVLIDKGNHTQYKLKQPGQATVSVMIRNGKNTITRLTGRYMEYLLAQVLDKNNAGKVRYSDPATVTRGKAEVEDSNEDDYISRYNSFRKQALQEYEDFRNKANKEYAEFMKKAWASYKQSPAIPRPKDEDVRPTIFPKEDEQKAIESKPQPIKEIIPPTVPTPQPKPVSPIREQPKPTETYVSFSYYGTELRIRFNEEERFTLKSLDNNTLAEAWMGLSQDKYNNTVRDCLEYRISLHLSDWAYLMMLKAFSESLFGNKNEATLLTAYIFCQSGYKMRLAKNQDKLFLFYASKHHIYNKAYYKISGDNLYSLSDGDNVNVTFCDINFPQEKPMSLYIPQQPLLAYNLSDERTLSSKRYKEMTFTTQVNKNLIDFYNDYPTSEVNDNFMTRWQMYANTPMDTEIKEILYPKIKEKLNGLSRQEAVERLLNWVQTAFVYEYDNKVWGQDRAFFAEETLYYPFCDCEDRSILFSRLVRDLLGMKVILVFYPGHLAAAVHIDNDVKGDYINLDGKHFTICDPTYIGAPVGWTMPDMDNKTASIILLE